MERNFAFGQDLKDTFHLGDAVLDSDDKDSDRLAKDMKYLLKLLLFITYILIVCVGGVEFIGRIFLVTDGNNLYLKKDQLFVIDKTLGYKLKPGFHIDGDENRLYPGISISIGSHGLRSDEFDDRPKILLVGDSIAFGYGIRAEDTIASQLEHRLKGKYQVVNAGVPGYNLDQWQIVGKELSSVLHPQILVALVNANDFQSRYYPIMAGASISRYRSYPWETELPQETVSNPDTYSRFLTEWAYNKFLAKWKGDIPSFRDLLMLSRLHQRQENSLEVLFASELKQIEYYNSKHFPETQEQFKQALTSLKRFSEQLSSAGTAVTFVFVPYRISSQRPNMGHDKRFDDLADGVKKGPLIHCIKVKSVLTEDRLFLPGDAHTSKQGNQVIAELISKAIS